MVSLEIWPMVVVIHIFTLDRFGKKNKHGEARFLEAIILLHPPSSL